MTRQVKTVRIIGDKVWVNGELVRPETPRGSRSKGESKASRDAREALESRYPGVKFKGDCSKITIGSQVELKPGVTIDAADAPISIGGKSRLAEGASVSTKGSGGMRGNNSSFNGCVNSFNGSIISVASAGSVSFHSGVSIGAGGASKAAGVQIVDSIIGEHAEIQGLSVVVLQSQVAGNCKVIAEGVGAIEVERGNVKESVVSTGSGNITVNRSEVCAEVNLSGSGDIDVKNSTISAPVSLSGSGNISVDGSNMQGVLSVAGSGNIQVSRIDVGAAGCLVVAGSGNISAYKNPVNRPYSVSGSDSIRL